MGMIRTWPEQMQLRGWQKEAFKRYVNLNQRDFLAVATPGSGKTLFALRVAHALLESGEVERVVIVCPTTHLRQQWADAASAVGINLNPEWINQVGAREAGDYQGVCVTYHSVASEPRLYQAHCRHSPTFVILDEIHHAGEERSWGDNIRQAFEFATRRLLLSGTPFRSDNNKMPFVRYQNDKSVSDFEYGYGFALRDRVCRPVLFPAYEGNMKWIAGADTYSHNFADKLSKARASERLRTALDPDSEWLQSVIGDADRQLDDLQQAGHQDAAGLILAIDQSHAQRIAKLLKELTGYTAVVVISDDKDATAKIKRFSSSQSRWIVAVKMVSEGVDIPRLRVGVYATNTLTELFFRQAIGRLLRVQGLEEESAYLYIPHIEELIGYAQEIKDERDHQLQEELDRLREEKEDSDYEDVQPKLFLPLDASAIPSGVVFDQSVYPQDELDQYKQIMQGMSLPKGLHPAHIAQIVRQLGDRAPAPPKKAVAESAQEKPMYERKGKIKQEIKRLVSILNAITKTGYETINTDLVRTTRKRLQDCTEEDLFARVDLLRKWIDEAKSAR